MTSFTQSVIDTIKHIPQGKVASYGQVAAIAGFPGAARQVVWVLHTSSEKEDLPWHRVINAQGKISLKPGSGHEQQKSLLEQEGVRFDASGTIDLDQYLWSPG
ncbi:MGMT family protein [bacterium]|nr:MGMT family protein [bacterium]